MVYAMFSIGILGFIVWSLWMGLFYRNIEVINFVLYWDSLFQIITVLNCQIIKFGIKPVRKEKKDCQFYPFF